MLVAGFKWFFHINTWVFPGFFQLFQGATWLSTARRSSAERTPGRKRWPRRLRLTRQRAKATRPPSTVGGFNRSEKYKSPIIGIASPKIWKNKTYSEPPTKDDINYRIEWWTINLFWMGDNTSLYTWISYSIGWYEKDWISWMETGI